MNYLSISAILQNEGRYVADWIKYHHGLGVEHFYLYENDSTDNTYEVLKSFPESLVTVEQVHGIAMQCPCIMKCLVDHREDSRWFAMIDCDEYIVPKMSSTLTEFLKPFERHAAMCPHWVYFGSNGETVYTPRPVVERFTKRAKETDRHVKSIIDPKRTIRWVTVHKYTHIGAAVDEHYRPIAETDSRPEPVSEDFICINHYVTKSYEECLERRSRMRADISQYHQMPDFFEHHDRNDIEDLTALNIWNRINQKITDVR